MRSSSGIFIMATEALAAVLTVAIMAWYLIARRAEYARRIERLDETMVGLLTLTIALLAGLLLAFAFARAEDVIAQWRENRAARQEQGE